LRFFDAAGPGDQEHPSSGSASLGGGSEPARSWESPATSPRPLSSKVGPDEQTRQIEAEIEETRAELSVTVEAIQEKLAPETLSEQAQDTAREVAEAALREARVHATAALQDLSMQAKQHAGELIQDLSEQARAAIQEVTEVAAREVKEHATQTVRDMTGQAKSALRDATIGKAEHMVSTAGQTVEHTSTGLLETMKQNPLPTALAAISLGWLFMKRSSSASQQPSYPYRAHPGQASTASAPRPVTTRYSASQTWQAPSHEDEHGSSGGLTAKVAETAGQAKHLAGEAASSAVDTATDLASTAGEAAMEFGGTLTHTAGQAVSSAGDLASTAVDTAVGAASSAGGKARDLSGTLKEAVVQNPMPAALMGVGLSWMLYNRSSSRRPAYETMNAGVSQSRSPYWQPSPVVGQADQGGLSGAVGQVKDKAGSAVGQVQQTAGQVVDQIQEGAGHLAGGAQDQAQSATGRLRRMAHDSPLVAAALAATAGATVGLLLPDTQREDQLLGRPRDQVMQQFRGVTEQTMEKVQKVAEDTESAVKQAAKEQSLTV
jgi:ribosome recycling factor